MAERYSRRDFLTGVVACGTLTAAAIYLLPGGRPAAPIELTLITGSDSTGARQILLEIWNEVHPNVRVRVEVVGGETGDQRQEMINRATSARADIINLDVIHIPYFADQELIAPIELDDASVFLDNTLQANRVNSDPRRFWAAPFNTDVGMLFERLAGGESPGDGPDLAQVLDSEVSPGSRQFVGQLRPTSSASEEAFVVNVLEHALSRDPSILDDNGIPANDLSRWSAALEPLRAAVSDGRVALSSTEADSLDQFVGTAGPRFMRNWPVKYRELQQLNDADVEAGRIRLRSLPTGILGGQSLAVVNGSRNHEAATEVIRFLTDDRAQRVLAAHGLAPARIGAYNDVNLKAFIPHLDRLRGAVEGARPRPIHPLYSRFSTVIVNHVGRLLSDNVDLPAQFIDEMIVALV